MATAADPSHYVIEYARPGSSEKCNGRPPCNGSTIVLGDLCFGTKNYNGRINDKMQYRHWGCVTPDILYDLAFVDVNRIPGIDRLNPADRLKIHTAVERLAIDPADIPVTARRPIVPKPSLPLASQANRLTAQPSAAPFGIQRPSAPAPVATTSKKRKAPVAKTTSLPVPAHVASPSQYSQPAAYSASQPTQASYSQAPQYGQPRATQAAHGGQITMTQQQRDDAAYLDDDNYDEEEAQYTDFYLSFQSTVVGIQYYDGLVGPGEQVDLVREPTNKYDQNAIQVMNIRMRQVGHIPRQTAANLAPLIDRDLIMVEGTMNDGNLQGRQYTLSVTLSIYGKPGVRSMLEPLLRWATPGKRGFTDAMRLQSGIALSQTASYSAGSSAGPSGTLSFYTYYGNHRNVDTQVLKAYDVVLTTYQTVSADFEAIGGFKTAEELLNAATARKKRKVEKSDKGLFEIKWKRVVLDEAHQIRNPKTKIAQSVSALEGYYRWAVSGTPIVNSPSDLGSLLTFLRMCTPLDQIAMFNRLLSRPLSKGDAAATALLKQLMKHISIRRSKEMQDEQGNRLVELPKVTVHVTNVELDGATRRIYDTVERLSRQRFVDMANAAENGESVPNVVLSLLTRMR
ncbi:hypothetical protein FRC08_011855 [Ceratobasidium sp. 394]|nr:hypothetical protein FRC08_011855 [Ceratobasidium sp. 394]